MKRPKITVMGQEVAWDDVDGTGASELAEHFKPVKLSARAINEASRLVPPEHWIVDGLHTWLQKRAEAVFKHLAGSEKEGRYRTLVYVFGFDTEGPVLERVYIYQG